MKTNVDIRNYMADLPLAVASEIYSYLKHRQVPRSRFVMSILVNDLKGACATADDDEKWSIWNIVSFLHTYADERAWGNAEKCKDWIAGR